MHLYMLSPAAFEPLRMRWRVGKKLKKTQKLRLLYSLEFCQFEKVVYGIIENFQALNNTRLRNSTYSGPPDGQNPSGLKELLHLLYPKVLMWPL